MSRDLKDLLEAPFMESFPCNPLPFLIGLTENIREKGGDWLKSDEGKTILWVVMAQAYGQLTAIDLMEEWERLYKLHKGD